MKSTRDKILNIAYPVITVGCILVLWTFGAIAAGSAFILPSVPETVSAMFVLLGSGTFYYAFFSTLLRSLTAFVLSFLIAFAFAALSKKYNSASRLISPIIGITRALPTVAVVLLLLFWTNSSVAPVVVTMIVVMPTMFTAVESAFFSVDYEAVNMCRAFLVPRKKIIKKVIMPQVMPPLLTAVGAGLSLNIKLMVAAEVISSTAKSLGNMYNYANYNLLTATMIALVVITVICGVIIEAAFKFISKKAEKRL